MTVRRTGLESLRHAAQAEAAAISDYWRKTRRNIVQMPVSRRDRAALLHRARLHEREVKRALYERARMQRDQFRNEQPFLAWAAFREMAKERREQLAKTLHADFER